ncbi:hypothetical protein RRG08_054450 [Elysia crispata]|uniref:Uncharacterized protein n=1 Tax=Elysia crispata TaxID=231223 RepID=A0AAE1AWV6_9GAST|nr:hypothetical protein RRG08_054450 [Elysia crispata]
METGPSPLQFQNKEVNPQLASFAASWPCLKTTLASPESTGVRRRAENTAASSADGRTNINKLVTHAGTKDRARDSTSASDAMTPRHIRRAKTSGTPCSTICVVRVN